MNSNQVIRAILIAATLIVGLARAEIFYEFTPLGELAGGNSYSSANGINDIGQVALTSSDDSGRRAVVWSKLDGLLLIERLSGFDGRTEGADINNNGAVVGFTENNPLDRQPYIWTPADGIRALNRPVGTSRGVASEINDSGQVAAYATDGSSTQGYRWTLPAIWTNPGNIDLLGELPGGRFASHGLAINELGDVAGVDDTDFGEEPLLWTQSDGITSLGDLPGGIDDNAAYALNDVRQVVGFSNDNGGRNAFYWTEADGMLALADLNGYSKSTAQDINNQGVVVGYVFDDFVSKAVIWEFDNNAAQYVVTDLGDRVNSNDTDYSGWLLVQARGINALGQIVGFGTNASGNTEAFLLDPNESPIADPGLPETVHLGQLIVLDGSASSDPDGDYPLNYDWTFVMRPLNSMAQLSNSDSVAPSFTPDLLGDYIVELVVTDSRNLSSPAVQLTIGTSNTPPVADAGLDISISYIGETIILDANGSYDPDGDDITYEWQIVDSPDGSVATVVPPTVALSSFIVDKHGDYEIQLTVTDEFEAESEPTTIRASFDNLAPVADAGNNQNVLVWSTVNLDGTESTDANLDDLTYNWDLVSTPEFSTASLDSPSSPTPSFVADLVGSYVISLVVFDGWDYSLPSNVVVEAISTVDDLTDLLGELIDVINGLDDGVFKNKNMKNALTNKLNAVLALIDQGDYQQAFDNLSNDIKAKTDGCSIASTPDRNDWIRDCSAQGLVFPIIEEALGLLEGLI